MSTRQRYRKKASQFVTAIPLNLDTDGLVYQKWGAEQRGKPGDWLVDNAGDIYTVDAKVFMQTYRQVETGKYVKTTPVWAEMATVGGRVKTNEGESHYEPGDYLVSNNADGTDSYCIAAEKFLAMYELDGS